MPFSLTSKQYVIIDTITQSLPPPQRQSFLVALAAKISRHARATQNRMVADQLLNPLIDAALRETQANHRTEVVDAMLASKRLLVALLEHDQRSADNLLPQEALAALRDNNR